MKSISSELNPSSKNIVTESIENSATTIPTKVNEHDKKPLPCDKYTIGEVQTRVTYTPSRNLRTSLDTIEQKLLDINKRAETLKMLGIAVKSSTKELSTEALDIVSQILVDNGIDTTMRRYASEILCYAFKKHPNLAIILEKVLGDDDININLNSIRIFTSLPKYKITTNIKAIEASLQIQSLRDGAIIILNNILDQQKIILESSTLEYLAQIVKEPLINGVTTQNIGASRLCIAMLYKASQNNQILRNISSLEEVISKSFDASRSKNLASLFTSMAKQEFRFTNQTITILEQSLLNPNIRGHVIEALSTIVIRQDYEFQESSLQYLSELLINDDTTTTTKINSCSILSITSKKQKFNDSIISNLSLSLKNEDNILKGLVIKTLANSIKSFEQKLHSNTLAELNSIACNPNDLLLNRKTALEVILSIINTNKQSPDFINLARNLNDENGEIANNTAKIFKASLQQGLILPDEVIEVLPKALGNEASKEDIAYCLGLLASKNYQFSKEVLATLENNLQEPNSFSPIALRHILQSSDLTISNASQNDLVSIINNQLNSLELRRNAAWTLAYAVCNSKLTLDDNILAELENSLNHSDKELQEASIFALAKYYAKSIDIPKDSLIELLAEAHEHFAVHIIDFFHSLGVKEKEFSNKTLNFLGKSLINNDSPAIRNKAFETLNLASKYQSLDEDLENILKLEEYSLRLINENKEEATKAIDGILQAAKAGQKLTKNCLASLEVIINGEDGDLLNDAAKVVKYITLNGQSLPSSLIESVNHKLLSNKSNNLLVDVFVTIIQESSYSSNAAIRTFEGVIDENQENIAILEDATSGIRILTQRNQILTENGIENVIKLISNPRSSNLIINNGLQILNNVALNNQILPELAVKASIETLINHDDKQAQIYSSILLKSLGEKATIALDQIEADKLLKFLSTNVDPQIEANLCSAISNFKQCEELYFVVQKVTSLNECTAKLQDCNLSIEERELSLQKIYELSADCDVSKSTIFSVRQALSYDDLLNGSISTLAILAEKTDTSFLDDLTEEDLEFIGIGLNKEEIADRSAFILDKVASKQKLPDYVLDQIANLLIESDETIYKDTLKSILLSSNKHQELPSYISDLLELDNYSVLNQDEEENIKIAESLLNAAKNSKAITSSNLDLLEELTQNPNIAPIITETAVLLIKNGQAITDNLLNKVIEHIDKIIAQDDEAEALEALHVLTIIQENYKSPFPLILENLENLLDSSNNAIVKDAFQNLRLGGASSVYEPSDKFWKVFENLLSQIKPELLEAGIIERLAEEEDINIVLAIIGDLLFNRDLTPEIVGKFYPEQWNRESLRAKLVSNIGKLNVLTQDEIDIFDNNLVSLEEYNDYPNYSLLRDEILQKLVIFQTKDHLDLKHLNELLVLLRVGHEKANFAISSFDLDFIKETWLKDRLEEIYPDITLSTVSIKNIESKLAETNLTIDLEERLLNLSRGQAGLESLTTILDFIAKYKLSQEELKTLLSQVDNLESMQRKISHKILENNVYKYCSNADEFTHQNILLKNLTQLLDNNWDLEAVTLLLESISSEQLPRFLLSLKIINDYKIKQEIVNSKGNNILDIFKNCPANIWELEIYDFVTQVAFKDEGREKDLNTINQEIISLNDGNDEILNLATSGLLKQQFANILETYNKDSSFQAVGKPIAEWTSENISQWASRIRQDPPKALDKTFLPEIIAIVKRTATIATGNDPRTTQIFSLLILLNAKDRGRLAQISTGEGKSTTTAMLSSIKVLQGEKVDVITSSPLLAKRDSFEWREFFEMLGITVSHNIVNYNEQNIIGFKRCYLSDIVYGDVGNFQYDLLKHEYKLQGTRGDRGFGTVIVDEVDSMMIDESSKIAKLSSPIPSSEYLEPIYTALWYELNRLDKHFVYLENKEKWFWVRDDFKYEDGKLTLLGESTNEEENIFEVEDLYSFRLDHLKYYLTRITNSNEDSGIVIPSHLQEFALSQIENWSKSAIVAKNMVEKRDYIVIKDQSGENNIAPVDYNNTGIVQENTSWINGLHQFLQIKHNLKIKAENLSTCFISNLGYFKHYGDRIFGMTGTLGSRDSRELLKHVYSIDLAFIPTYKQKQFIELPGIVAETSEEWLVKVISNVKNEADKQRAVLVICETIQDVEQIEAGLIEVGCSPNKIKIYSRSDNQEHLGLNNNIDSGEIIIATNLAGRGTDIKTTKTVEDRGGLHVCVTFMPTNLRVEEQAFGRTSRQGKKGTGQLIIDKFHALGKLNIGNYPINNIEELKTLRNQVEQDRIKEVKLTGIDKIINDDWLFSSFCKFTQELRNRENNKYKLMQLEETWGIWLKKFQEETNIKNNSKPSDTLVDNASLYGFKCQSLEQSTDSLYACVSSLLQQRESAHELKAKAIAYLLDRDKINISNFPLPETSKPTVLKIAVSDELISQNAFNQKNNPNYYYQATDIAVIQAQIMSLYQNNFNIHQPMGDSQNLSNILQQIVSSATKEKPSIVIYNKGNLHWVAFVVTLVGDRKVVLYKDSQGNGNEQLKQELLQSNSGLAFIANKHIEQLYGVDCGIFALQNMQIMANKILSNLEGFIQEFENFGEFCTLQNARNLRKDEFAEKYVIGRYYDDIEEARKKSIYSILRNHHQTEVQDLVILLHSSPRLNTFNIRVLGADDNIIETSFNTINLEIGLTECNNNNYEYCYRLEWSRDINPKEELQEFIRANNLEVARLDIASRVIRIKPQILKTHLNISQLVLPSPEVNIQTLYDNLSIVQNQNSKEEASALLQKYALPYRESNQLDNVNVIHSNIVETNVISTVPIKATELNQINDRLTDEDILEALSVSLNASIIVIPSDGTSPKIIKRIDCKEMICLGHEVVVESNPAQEGRYFPLTSSSSIEPSKDITSLFELQPSNTELELISNVDPINRHDVRLVIDNLESQELVNSKSVNEVKRKVALEQFNKFKHGIEAVYLSGNKIMQNSLYLGMQAFNEIGAGNRYRASIELFSDSINLDPIYSFSAYYNRAYATIREGTRQAGQARSGKINHNYQVESANDLLMAKDQIEQYIIPQLQAMQIIAPKIDNNPLSRQIKTKINLFKMIIEHIDEAVNVIRNCDSGDYIKISRTQLIRDFFDPKNVPTAEINELNYMGMHQVFGVEAVTPDTNMLDAVAVAVIGAVQIGVGIIGILSGNPLLIASSLSSIISGVQDLAKAAAIANGEPLDWKNYLTMKGIEIGVKLATMGIEAGCTNMAAQSATREATKKGLEEAAKKGLTGEAAKEYARQFAIETTKTTIKESTKLVGKELTKAVFHAATEKLVHYGITKTINHLGKQYIKDCRSDIESGVRKRLENLFTNRNTQKQIDHILAIDNFNKTPQFQRNLMQAASDLLQQKTTILSQFTSQLCDALMFSSNVNPIITGGAIVVKGAEIGNNVSKILDLTDEFCDRLGERIASIEQRLATIANMLHQKLTPKINHADAIKIIEILRHHGILKNDWEFDASKLGFIEGIETYDALDQGNIRELILKDVSKIELSRNSNSDLSDIEQLDFGEYVEYKAEVIDLCRRLQASLTANHSNLRRQIESDISSMVTGSIMARIQGQIISPISSSVASMASRKVTEKLTEFGSDVMKSTREMLGSREGPVGVASGDEIGGGGLLDRLFKRSKKKNVLETKKVETGEKRWELAETELFVKHIEQIIGLENETSKAQIEYVGQFINGIKYEYAAEMVHEYNEMAERSKNPPDFRQAFSNVMQRHFQGQTPGMRVNIDLLGESLGYVGDQFGRILDIQNPALKANIGAVSSMVGTRVGNILEYTGISPYIKQVHDLADQHLAKGEQKILGLALGTGIPMGASKLVGMLKSRYGTNKLVPKVSVGKLEHAKTTVIVKPNHAISDIKAPNSIHKNSHNYVGDTHIYRILDSNGKTYKIGESARGVRKKDGKSIRGEAQARKLHEQTGEYFTTEVRGNFASKKEGHKYQNQLIKRFKRVGGDKSLPGNKSNY